MDIVLDVALDSCRMRWDMRNADVAKLEGRIVMYPVLALAALDPIRPSARWVSGSQLLILAIYGTSETVILLVSYLQRGCIIAIYLTSCLRATALAYLPTSSTAGTRHLSTIHPTIHPTYLRALLTISPSSPSILPAPEFCSTHQQLDILTNIRNVNICRTTCLIRRMATCLT